MRDLLDADRIERKVDKAILKRIEENSSAFEYEAESFPFGKRVSRSVCEIVRAKYAAIGWVTSIREGDWHELYLELRFVRESVQTESQKQRRVRRKNDE